MGNLRFMTAGESHGPCLTGIIEGLPAGIKIDIDEINRDLARRQKGYGRGGRMKIETDKAEILSGVRFGETLGSPVTLRVTNRDFANWQERMSATGEKIGEKVTAARPGHADLTGVLKYDREDVRDILERSSARETTMRVALGALCKIFLKKCGINIYSQVIEVGGEKISEEEKAAFAENPALCNEYDEELNCRDQEAAKRMKERIDKAKAAGDTLGGKFVVAVTGCPAGLGSFVQWDRRLDGRLAGALMSIQAVKSVEIGAGEECAQKPGSEIHDEIFLEEGKIRRKTNRAGGLEGGMTNGENIIISAVMKPIPTLMRPLLTIDIDTKKAVSAAKERSDVCAVPAASVVGEAMTALILAEAVTDKFGGDALCDTLTAMKIYDERIKGRWQ